MLPSHSRLLAAVCLASAICATSSPAQDTSAARPHEQSAVGSARISLDASYARPRFSDLEAAATVAPFVSTHWQVGVAPAIQFVRDNGNNYFAGSAATIANFFPRTTGGWLPYVGGYFSEGSASFSSGSGYYGGQAGLLHFLSPAVAFRAELRYRREAARGSSYESSDLYLTLDPYLFGRATRGLTTLPAFGVFDASVFGDLQLRPSHMLAANGTIAPFLTHYLQAGVTGTALFTFDVNSGYHDLEWFGRAYLPVDRRVLPFADGFVAAHYLTDNETERSHGARAGVRTYLTAGVALDVAFEWRNYAAEPVGALPMIRPEARTVRAALTTQFRARRRSHGG
jgi:hypothetical protein